jgi:hypothetical protein
MIYKSLLSSYAFLDGKVEDIDVANVQFLRAIEFEFNGTLTAAGGTSDGALREDGLLKTVLARLQLKADSDPHVETHGQAEWFRRAILSGSPGVLGSTMPTGEAATAQRVHARLDMDEVASGAKFAGRIDVRKLGTLSLRVTMGVCETDMVTGGDRAETLTGTLDVFALYDDGNGEVGNPAGLGYRGGGRRITAQRVVVTAANNRLEAPIPADLYIGKMLFLVVDNGVRDNDLLDKITVKIGEREFVRSDLTWEELQSDNVEAYGLALSSGLPPYTGVAVLDFDADGDLSPQKVLNTVGLRANAAKCVLTVGAPTGTSYVEIFCYGVDPAGVGRQMTGIRR